MFSSQVKTALGGAENVARLYMVEKGRGIIIDAGEIADALQRDPRLFDEERHVKLPLMIARLVPP